jgi:hypothetical protein
VLGIPWGIVGHCILKMDQKELDYLSQLEEMALLVRFAEGSLTFSDISASHEDWVSNSS